VVERGGAEQVVRRPEEGRLIATNRFRALGVKAAREGGTGLCPRYDTLRAWLADRSGTLDPEDQPVVDSGVAAGRLAAVSLQPATQTVRVATPPGQPEAPAIVLRWSPETKTVAPALGALQSAMVDAGRVP
jgi:hypothetical protein